MRDVDKKIGERIYQVRNKRGYTRRELAKAADISIKFLYEMETGRKGFSAGVLSKICQELCISADYILMGMEPEQWNIQIAKNLELLNEWLTTRKIPNKID